MPFCRSTSLAINLISRYVNWNNNHCASRLVGSPLRKLWGQQLVESTPTERLWRPCASEDLHDFTLVYFGRKFLILCPTIWCMAQSSKRKTKASGSFSSDSDRLMFGVKRTITSYCFTLLSKIQMSPLFLVLLLSYALWRQLCRFKWIINPVTFAHPKEKKPCNSPCKVLDEDDKEKQSNMSVKITAWSVLWPKAGGAPPQTKCERRPTFNQPIICNSTYNVTWCHVIHYIFPPLRLKTRSQTKLVCCSLFSGDNS